MTLTELIAGVEAQRKTLTVFNATSAETIALRDHFADRNIDVVAGEATDGPERFVVLRDGATFLTAASVETVLSGEGIDTPDGGQTRPILDHLDETTFTSYDTEQMAAASNEIEDRAWRVGAGTVFAGFGTVSDLCFQLDRYERLASRASLSVQLYAVPDQELPDHDDVVIQLERSQEIESTWFVVFDGNGMDEKKCALMAHEREPGSFYGFWTYDPGTVDWIVDHLLTNYTITDVP